MSRTNVLGILACGAVFMALVGCHADTRTAIQQDMDRMDKTLKTPRAHLTNQVDNATLHDMSLADFHFVPHSTELSGSGVARLDRMALMLDTYGGTLRYETAITDEKLLLGRMDHVKEYLTLVGCSMEKITIATALSGGRGTPARDAMASHEEAKAQQNTLNLQQGFAGSAGQ